MISKEHVVSESEVYMGNMWTEGLVPTVNWKSQIHPQILKSAHVSGLYLRTPTPIFWGRSSIQPNIFKNKLGALTLCLIHKLGKMTKDLVMAFILK